MKTQRILTAVLALALPVGLAAANPVLAQVSGKGGPIAVGSDQWHAEQNIHTEFLDGRVEIVQDDARLRADHVKIVHTGAGDGKGWGDVVTMEASGNIYYVTTDKIVKGDNAVYTKASDTMVITGDVILQQGENVMTGNRLVSEVTNGVTTMDASPTTTGKGRVKGVFYPDDKTAPASAAAPAQPAPASH